MVDIINNKRDSRINGLDGEGRGEGEGGGGTRLKALLK